MKHQSIASSHFSPSTLRGLSQRGIFIIGLQAIPDFSQPLGYVSCGTGYIVSDNECGKVWTGEEVRHAAEAPYLAGIADTAEEAELTASSLFHDLKAFAASMRREEKAKREETGEDSGLAILTDHRETIRNIDYAVGMLADFVDDIQRDFLNLYPHLDEGAPAGDEKEEEVVMLSVPLAY